MAKLSKDQAGFGAVEIVAVLVIIIIISTVGIVVAKHNQKNNQKDSSKTALTNTTQAVHKDTGDTASKKPDDIYAGWKSYTLQYEKLSFRYPASWTISDQSLASGRHDDVTLNGPNNFTFHVIDGVQNGGDPSSLASDEPISLTFLEKPAHMVFSHPKVSHNNMAPTPDTNTVGGALLLTNPNDQYSQPADKNVLGSSQYNGVNGPEGSYMSVYASYGNTNYMSLAAAKADAQYSDSKLVLQSMHY